MNENLKALVDKIVLNEEISLSTRLSAIEQVQELSLLLKEPAPTVSDYLKKQSATKSTVTNQLAQSALDWLEEKNNA